MRLRDFFTRLASPTQAILAAADADPCADPRHTAACVWQKILGEAHCVRCARGEVLSAHERALHEGNEARLAILRALAVVELPLRGPLLRQEARHLARGQNVPWGEIPWA